MTDPAVYDWSKYQPVLDEAQRARLDRPGDGLRARAALGDQRRARHRHAPEPERVPHVHDRGRRALRRRRSRAGRSGTSPTTRSSCARSTTAATARCRRRSTATSTPPRCAAWRRPATRSPVLMGETAPSGTGKVVAPLTFLRGALCLTTSYKKPRQVRQAARRRLRPPRLHHAPGPVLQARRAQRRDDRRAVAADQGARPRGARPASSPSSLPVYLTEFGIQSTPDPLFGVSLQRQAEYRSISERIAYDNPRVAAFSQYLLHRRRAARRHVPTLAALRRLRVRACAPPTGKAKPALDGFRLPLVGASARAAKVSLWGLVRPAGGATQVVVQQRDQRQASWTTLDDRDAPTAAAPSRRRHALGLEHARVARAVDRARRARPSPVRRRAR